MPAVRIWLILQLITITILLSVFPHTVSDIVTWVIYQMPYPHGFVKGALESSQGLILRQSQIPLVMTFGFLVPILLSILDGTKWMIAAVACAIIGFFLLPHYGLVGLLIFFLLLGATGLPQSLRARFERPLLATAWVPALGAFPLISAIALGLKNPFTFRIWIGLGGALLGFTWIWADCLTHYKEVRYDMERWPAELLSPELVRLAQKVPCSECPPTILCRYCSSDWHGLRLTKDYALVAGEMNPRVIAFPFADGEPIEYRLTPRDESKWAFPSIDVELDERKEKIWVLDRGQVLVELSIRDGSFQELGRYPLPNHMSFAYFTRSEDRLMITSVHVEGDSERRVTVMEQPTLRHIDSVVPDHDGQRIPMPRESLWVPSINKLILAPDFGTHLYAMDIETGQSSPWLELPTMNGKMIWLPESEHLLLALPNRFELWRVDPRSAEVIQRIPTQPGVRTLAVDEERGLLVTVSVLTGRIWIQDLADGHRIKSLGTVMPMVRQLKLDTDRGIGVLTTWIDVYRFSYLPKK